MPFDVAPSGLAARQAKYFSDNDHEGDSVGKPGSDNEVYERNTWPELERLAREMPEAGIHFQGEMVLHQPH